MAKKPYGKANFQRELKEQQDEDAKLRQLTFALFRQLGRVRVKAEGLAALDPRDQVTMQTDPATGDIIVSYVSAANEEPGGPPGLLEKVH